MPVSSRNRTACTRRRAVLALMAWTIAMLSPSDSALAALSFSTPPALPALPTVTLNGQLQTTTTTMTDFAITNTTPRTGWNLTVAGQSGPGESPVFAQYCPNPTCGTDTGPGYVAGGSTLAADSLTLDSTGAGWTSGSVQPVFQCNSGCFIDDATATKVVSAPTNVTPGTLTTTGFSPTSLALTTPTTVKKLQTTEVYRVNVVWTLNSGP